VASLPINNPQRILQALDSNLERQTRVVLFGRAALAMGFGEVGAQFGNTQDVDAILPTVEMSKIEADSQFWNAIELTNRSLEPSGLYVSHLFTDKQIAITSDWLDRIVAIPSEGYRFLRLFRPSAADLILTKMMRNDREDLDDIRFIMSQERVSEAELHAAFLKSVKLEIPELQSIFAAMQPIVVQLAREIEMSREPNTASRPQRSWDPNWWAELTKQTPHEKGIEKDRGIEI